MQRPLGQRNAKQGPGVLRGRGWLLEWQRDGRGPGRHHDPGEITTRTERIASGGHSEDSLQARVCRAVCWSPSPPGGIEQRVPGSLDQRPRWFASCRGRSNRMRRSTPVAPQVRPYVSPGRDDVSVASVVKALGSGGPAFLGRAIDPVAQRHVTETETRRGWFRPRSKAAGSATAGLGRRDACQPPQGSTNARETRICSPWADIGSHLWCWLSLPKIATSKLGLGVGTGGSRSMLGRLGSQVGDPVQFEGPSPLLGWAKLGSRGRFLDGIRR